MSEPVKHPLWPEEWRCSNPSTKWTFVSPVRPLTIELPKPAEARHAYAAAALMGHSAGGALDVAKLAG